MDLKELIEKRSAKLKEADALIPSNGAAIAPRAELRFTQLMDEVDTLGSLIAGRNGGEYRASTRPPRSQPGAELRSNNVQRQKDAFREWMRSGQVSTENRQYLRSAAESRDMGVSAPSGNITGGSVMVPTGFDPQLHSALLSAGGLVAAVRHLNTDSGQPIRVTLDDDTANTLQILAETVAASESDVPVSGLTSNVDELTTGMISVSNQLLNDSAFSVDDFISQKFAVRYYRGLAKMIALGNGSNIQKLTPGACITGQSGETNFVTFDDLVNVFSSLDALYVEQASWVMNSATKGNLMKLKDNYGHPLLQPDATGKPFNSLFGRPIVISPFSDNMGANNTPIMFGDLSSYTLRTVGGLNIARSEHFKFSQNEVCFAGFTRAGGYNTSQASSPAIVGYKNSAS